MKYSEVLEEMGVPRNLPDSDEYAYLTHAFHDCGNELWAENVATYFSGNPFQEYMPFKWDIPFPPVENPKFTFIDLFSGIGGFRLALQSQGGKCMFSSEWDRSAKRTYFKNFGEVPFGDIRAFSGEHHDDVMLDVLIPDHTILAAGFPCQPFSRAGVSSRSALGKDHGFACKAQGTLFFDVVRIAKVKQPNVLFLENVRNLKNHDGGRTFETIKGTIEQDLGYSFFETVIDARTVVPQKRARCFMVCFKDAAIDFEFPDFAGEEIPLRTALEKKVPSKYTISDRLWAGHRTRTQRNLDRGTGFTAFEADLDKPANTLVSRYGKDGKECLIPQHGKNPRKLTPRECARLQGFPEEYCLPDSDAAAYRQFGNSVAVPVVREIAHHIVAALGL